MAFVQRKLTKSFNQSRDIFDKFIYKSDIDNLSEILDTNYFNESRFLADPDWLGSIIEISGVDGYAIASLENGTATALYNSVTGGSFNPTTDMTLERLFDGLSTTTPQQPTGLGTANAKQIDFGPAFGNGSDPVSLSSDGTVSINQTGTYRIKVALQFGRTGASGTSVLLFRVRVNDIQAGRSIVSKISNSNEEQYFENDTWITLPAGTTLKFDVMRDASGNDSGGLFGFDPTVDSGNEWNDAPSAAIRVERWV